MPSTTSELADLQRALGQLRSSVSALHARYGNHAAVRRIDNDVDRLDIDVADLAATSPAPAPRPSDHDTVVVPDTPYDPDLWRDVDDEGVGGHHPHRP